jgi:hypothetical protein
MTLRLALIVAVLIFAEGTGAALMLLYSEEITQAVPEVFAVAAIAGAIVVVLLAINSLRPLERLTIPPPILALFQLATAAFTASAAAFNTVYPLSYVAITALIVFVIARFVVDWFL